MDFRERIEEDENALQEIVSGLPGFEGYFEREKRRAADKMLREHLCGQADEATEDLERVSARWSRAGELDYVADLERVAGLLRRAGDRLRFADYGYTGFFDAVKIGEDELQRFYEYDLSLRGFIADIKEEIGKLAAAGAEEVPVRIADLEEAMEALSEMIDERENVAASLTP